MKMNLFQTFKGKTVIISGSSKGIGKVLARELGLMGANIVLNGTNKETLDLTKQEFEVLGIDTIAVAADVSVIDDCKKIAEAALNKFKGIDIVVANAGMAASGSFEECDPFVFKHMIDINYLGVVYLVKACLPALKISEGNILITGSVSGLRGMPGYGAYSTSKMALTGLADALRIELKPLKVNVGIAYVSFTQNDEGKLMFGANGKLTSTNRPTNVKMATQYSVAMKMINMLRKRQFKKVFSVLGVITDLIVRFVPSLGSFILEKNYQQRVVPEHATPVVEYPFT